MLLNGYSRITVEVWLEVSFLKSEFLKSKLVPIWFHFSFKSDFLSLNAFLESKHMFPASNLQDLTSKILQIPFMKLCPFQTPALSRFAVPIKLIFC